MLQQQSSSNHRRAILRKVQYITSGLDGKTMKITDADKRESWANIKAFMAATKKAEAQR
jgi:hypothetical protein